MSLTNPKTVVTEERLSAFYQKLLPYLGGSADAGFTPVGTIIPMIAENAPANYLKCNGDTYNKSDYPELADHLLSMTYNTPYIVDGDDTKFKVPDLRGEFLRGISTNGHTGEGNGARVGEHQAGTEIPYNMLSANGARSNGFINSTGTSQQNRINASADKLGGSPDKIFQIVTTEGSLASGQHEYYKVRPTNTSVLLCIATKNIYLNPSLDYSTTEKVVGTWIDGKPLYQKSIPFTISSSNHKATIDISSLSVETLISGEAYTSWKSSGSIQGQFIITGTSMNSSGGGYSSAMFTASGNTALTIQYSGTENLGLFDTMDGYATIRYTKTT